MVERPFFIVGTGRSGTTLMRAMLSAHSRVSVTPETNFVSTWARLYPWLDLRRDDHLTWFWRRYAASRPFRHMDLDGNAILEKVRRDPDRRSYRGVFATLLEAWGAREGVERIGEKTPPHHAHAQQLFDWFPDATIVWMVRDPRASIASYLKTPWARWSVAVHAEEWASSAVRASSWPAERVEIVRYEDLVADPEPVLRRVVRLIGEDFEPAMLEHHRADAVTTQNYDGWVKGHIEKVRKPVNTSSIDRWRGELAPDQVGLIEAVAGDAMRLHGYTLAQPALARSPRLQIRARAELTAEAANQAVRAANRRTLRAARQRLVELPLERAGVWVPDVQPRNAP